MLGGAKKGKGRGKKRGVSNAQGRGPNGQINYEGYDMNGQYGQ